MSTHSSVEAHPLVHAYLADLDRALTNVDPRERADVIGGVREHLHDALGEDGASNSSRVRQVLSDLGPVETIAAQATVTTPQYSNRGDTPSALALIAALAAAATFMIPFVSAPLAIAALITGALHLRHEGANKRRCWLAICVAAAVLLFLVLTAASLLMVSTVDVTPTPVTTSSPLMSN